MDINNNTATTMYLVGYLDDWGNDRNIVINETHHNKSDAFKSATCLDADNCYYHRGLRKTIVIENDNTEQQHTDDEWYKKYNHYFFEEHNPCNDGNNSNIRRPVFYKKSQ